MNRAAAAELITVGDGTTTEFMRLGHVGARAGDARMRQRGRRTNLLGATDVGEVDGMAETAGRSRFG